MEQSLVQGMTSQAAFDGQPANLVTLQNSHGMQVVLMDIGATWLSCQVSLAEGAREVLLGVNTMADFIAHQSFLGVTVGRYANRIAKGRFSIDGQDYQVSTNQAGNTLHGGVEGFDKRRWSIESQSVSAVTFSLVSDDGDQGFPGKVNAAVTYTLTDDNQVVIGYKAITDKTTPVNLTNHAYFNLMGAESGADCREHRLMIAADRYLPTNDVGIPHGELKAVEGTGFDFREAKLVAQDIMSDEDQIPAKGYDHSYLFDTKRDPEAPVAVVTSPDGRITLSVFTDKPAMQLYTGNWLEGTPNRSGGTYFDYAGLALETQFLPDSPNHPEWEQPSCFLKLGEEYAYQTVYQFDC
ncbi:galactose-1-epimerase [Enterovibrio sp. ZSDZ35]|uniref:Aldose 1-epimerase n=1 Tax=Enterovibrio qingdaonensis TaxID=2899818 RepID=A0ABT5QNQ7_9GAMM|nr:galactose-1-epimerase [Enterovibrio sp. ZSDZ35]MDD1782617.1 galactose-1-epimerase [Enterovibrio sp. ZSDZ35]